MIERVERYVFTLRPAGADLMHAWAKASNCSPEHLAYRLLMLGVVIAAEREIGRGHAGVECAQDERYQEHVLAALRAHLSLQEQQD